MAIKRKSTGPLTHNRVSNGGFEDKLSGWSSAGAAIISAESGRLVHTGTQAAILSGSNAFITQTVAAGRNVRLEFIAHLRGVADLSNGPVAVRLRWVDSTGAFMGTALEIFVPQKQLSKQAWTVLWNVTNVSPTGTAGLNVRIDAPMSEGDAAVVVDDIVVRAVS